MRGQWCPKAKLGPTSEVASGSLAKQGVTSKVVVQIGDGELSRRRQEERRR